MRKVFYFTLALVCLLAFGLVSCDLDLIPQPQTKNPGTTTGNTTGNTGQDKLLEVKATVDGKSLVIAITKSKPVKAVAKSVASGNYYQITLGGTTISWGMVVVVPSSGDIGFFPDAKSPGGTIPFQGTLTASNEVKIPTIPVQGKAITDVEAGANGGTGKATFNLANLADVLNPPIITQPENPVTPVNPVTKDDPPSSTQRTLTIKGFPEDTNGKYVWFYACYVKDEGNWVSVMGYDSDTKKAPNGDLSLFPAEITNGKAELKLYSRDNNGGDEQPYTGSEILINLCIYI